MKDIQPTLIKIAAVITASPRWVTASLMAEGFALPESWLAWWIPLSAVSALGMAIVEAAAFAYVLEAYRNQSGAQARNLALLAMLSALIFCIVLTPPIAASIQHVGLADILTGFWLYAWGACIALSTVAIVATVGYAQKARALPRTAPQHATQQTQDAAQPVRIKSYLCDDCGLSFASSGAYAAHMRHSHARQNGHKVAITEGENNHA